MPAESKVQQRAAGIALHGKPKRGSVAAQMKKSMSKKELRKFAETKHKGLPQRKKKKVKEDQALTLKPFLIEQLATKTKQEILDEAGMMDVLRGAAGAAKEKMQQWGKKGEDQRNIQLHQGNIPRYVRDLVRVATDRHSAAPIAQRLVNAVLQLNKLGVNGNDVLNKEAMTYAKQVDLQELKARVQEAMRYFGVNTLNAPQQQPQDQQQLSPMSQKVQQPTGRVDQQAPMQQAPQQGQQQITVDQSKIQKGFDPRQQQQAPQQSQQQAPQQGQQQQAPQSQMTVDQSKIQKGFDPRQQQQRTARKKPAMVQGQHGAEYKWESKKTGMHMKLLNELLALDEAGGISHRAAAKVYHRDYVRTKDKPYRQHEPEKKRKPKKSRVKEDLDFPIGRRVGNPTQRFSKYMSTGGDAQNLRHDLHLLRLLVRETHPKEQEVATNDKGEKILRLHYPFGEAKASGLFDQFRSMFGEPRTRSHLGGILQALFKDRLTGTSIVLKYNPDHRYYVAEVPLRSATVHGGLGEYYMKHVSNLTRFLNEGKMTADDIFWVLVETPGVGHGFGTMSGADAANGTADLRKDVSGATDAILYVRDALAKHLKADNHDWVYFSNASSVEEAAKRAREIINKLPQSHTATPEAIHAVAEQVARVYWGH